MRIIKTTNKKIIQDRRINRYQRRKEISRRKRKSFFHLNSSTTMMRKSKILSSHKSTKLNKLIKNSLIKIFAKLKIVFSTINRRMLKVFLILNPNKRKKRNNLIFNLSVRKSMPVLKNPLKNRSWTNFSVATRRWGLILMS